MSKYIKIDNYLTELKSDLKNTPTLIKHCTVAVSKKGSGFKKWKGQSREFGAFSMCRHVMSRPYHKGTKKGEPPFYKHGSAVGRVSDIKRTKRGVNRDLKHTQEKGGRAKTAAFNRKAKKIEKEYLDLLDKEKKIKGLVKNKMLQKPAWSRAIKDKKRLDIRKWLKTKLDKLS